MGSKETMENSQYKHWFNLKTEDYTSGISGFCERFEILDHGIILHNIGYGNHVNDIIAKHGTRYCPNHKITEFFSHVVDEGHYKKEEEK
ncbi:hypothetical protein KAR91_30345 [Candidatus Pacearchaeota archaeon]|nr:hypothetical protein [Candidatus Pacearchaeota archaeon]